MFRRVKTSPRTGSVIGVAKVALKHGSHVGIKVMRGGVLGVITAPFVGRGLPATVASPSYSANPVIMDAAVQSGAGVKPKVIGRCPSLAVAPVAKKIGRLKLSTDYALAR